MKNTDNNLVELNHQELTSINGGSLSLTLAVIGIGLIIGLIIGLSG